MKILIISQYFPPEIGAAATRWSEYSNILQEMGHEVTILCEIPNYPTGIITEGYSKYRTAYENSIQVCTLLESLSGPALENQQHSDSDSLLRLCFLLCEKRFSCLDTMSQSFPAHRSLLG